MQELRCRRRIERSAASMRRTFRRLASPHPTPGALLILLGAGLRWDAIVTVGRYFTGVVTVQAEQQIIHHGPSRWVRHRSYTDILLIIAGLGLMMANWASFLILFLSFLIPLLSRIAVEERALLATFGATYEAYRQRTKRLIPFVY